MLRRALSGLAREGGGLGGSLPLGSGLYSAVDRGPSAVDRLGLHQWAFDVQQDRFIVWTPDVVCISFTLRTDPPFQQTLSKFCSIDFVQQSDSCCQDVERIPDDG